MSTKLPVRTRHGGLPTSDFAAILCPDADDGANLSTRPDTSVRLEAALAAARELLVNTSQAIDPGTSARDLFACLKRYRAHLAAVVAACPVPGGGDGA